MSEGDILSIGSNWTLISNPNVTCELMAVDPRRVTIWSGHPWMLNQTDGSGYKSYSIYEFQRAWSRTS